MFQELIPEGSGELVMKTAMDDEEDEETGSASTKSKNIEVSLFRGVQVNIKFNKNSESLIMSQLSGGQKALVALALIFAIQRCDPAPFYLFDELDQALDSTHRAAVASLIRRQATSDANPTQFITSTFRPELVGVAARCYGISHQNKISQVHQLTKKDALAFIANLQTAESGGVNDSVNASASSAAPPKGSGLDGAGTDAEESDDDENDDNNVEPKSKAKGKQRQGSGSEAGLAGSKHAERAAEGHNSCDLPACDNEAQQTPCCRRRLCQSCQLQLVQRVSAASLPIQVWNSSLENRAPVFRSLWSFLLG